MATKIIDVKEQEVETTATEPEKSVDCELCHGFGITLNLEYCKCVNPLTLCLPIDLQQLEDLISKCLSWMKNSIVFDNDNPFFTEIVTRATRNQLMSRVINTDNNHRLLLLLHALEVKEKTRPWSNQDQGNLIAMKTAWLKWNEDNKSVTGR